MKRLLVLAAAATVAATTSGLGATALAAPSQAGLTHRNVHVCGSPAAGHASCDSIRHELVDRNGRVVNPNASSPSSTGKTPSDIQSAYGLAGTTGTGRTVAIVDAYDDPTAESDVGVYRSTYKLPALNAGGPTFRKVDQNGNASYPRVNGGWAQEISLDLDMVSATCPSCNILLVEAASSSFANLGTAVNTAVGLGAVAISNSYGGSDSAETSAYNHTGVAITASTGDNGYQVQSPASFTHVVAVGGTSLTKASNARGWSETAWSGAGSGCSTINSNLWQTGTSCAGKANADVSAVADPNTGVNVYDSTKYQGLVGWLVFGGTSASSPIIASVYALANNFGSYAGQYTWTNHSTTNLNDVTSGSNGTCSTTIWCHAGTGWDGPTGLGTPNGTGAF